MALVRYTPRSTFVPWPELDLFSNRLSRVFGNAWDEPDLAGNWIPDVNVEESADELLLTAELPGMREEDVNVNIKNNILTIRGEKREAREEADEESVSLRASLQNAQRADGSPLMTPLSGVALMVFFVLACQCMSTLVVVRKEAGGWGWPTFMFGYMSVLAYVASLAVYQVGSVFGLGV